MMKTITSLKKLFSLALIMVLGQTAANADNKVYVSDFSIAAGEEAEIAINFDTEATDIRGIEGYITMPAGLTVVNDGYGANQRAKADATRANGFMANYAPSTALIKVRGMMAANVFTGTTGAVAYMKVKADESLAATATVKVSDFTIEHSDGTKEAATVADATVTNTSATEAANTLAVDPAEITLAAGGTAEVMVTLANSAAITGFQTTIELPEGITAEVAKTDRTQDAMIFNYNAQTKVLNCWSMNGISGNEGAVFTLKLTAGNDFKAPAEIALNDVKITDASAKSIALSSVVIKVKEGAAPVVDKSELTKEIEAATALLADNDPATEPGKSLKEAIDAAKAVAAKADATKEDVAAAIEALKKAEDTFKAAQQGEQPEVKETVIYSWSTTPGEESVTINEVGGKVVASEEGRVGYANIVGDVTYTTISLNGKKDFSTSIVTLTLDNELKAGDKIVITAYRNKNEAGKKSGALLKFEKGETNVSTATNGGLEFVNLNEAVKDTDEYGTEPNTVTLTVPEDAAGSKVITMTRAEQGTNLFITKLEITTEATTTGISTVAAEKQAEGIYTLSGQRVKAATKGLYIINGKKVMVK